LVVTGIYYALGLVAGGLATGYLLTPFWGGPFYLLAAFCLWFFRDPERKIPQGPVAVSPADGKIVQILNIPPDHTRISIFLNVFDVHVNRSPISGKIVDVQYSPGKFLVASKDEASSENERNLFVVQGQDVRVAVTQIAGLIARRIVFNKKPGDFVTHGERIGLIKFGSRTDILLGPEWDVAVTVGQRVQGGSSIIARRKGK
jgi:phosphatidylserine decarboxylase